MRPRGLYKTLRFSVAPKGKTQSHSVALKKISVGHKDATTFIINSVSRKDTMSDLIFHVYEKDNKVKAHNLTVDQLEELIISKKVNIGEDEIQPLELSKNTEGSY